MLPAVAPAATTAASATISAIAAEATTAAAPTSLGFGARFVDVDGASANLLTVESGDGFFAVFVTIHFYETETAGAAGVTIGHDADAVDLSVGLEHLPQFVFVRVEAQVPHKDILHASSPALSCRKCKLRSANLAGRRNRS